MERLFELHGDGSFTAGEYDVNVVFCDGSTRFLSQDIDDVVLALMMSCDDENTRPASGDGPVSAFYRRDAERDK